MEWFPEGAAAAATSIPLMSMLKPNDKVGLSEWLREGRIETIQSLVIKPPAMGGLDAKPFGQDAFAKLLYANIVFQTQFAIQHDYARPLTSHSQAKDVFGVYGMKTSRRQRDKDECNGILLHLSNSDARTRRMAVVGTHSEESSWWSRKKTFKARCLYTCGSAIWLKDSCTYNYVEDLYLVPAVYRDAHPDFFTKREQRMEELSETTGLQVAITVVRHDNVIDDARDDVNDADVW
eukprot:772399-Amphidinium_carterae.1